MAGSGQRASDMKNYRRLRGKLITLRPHQTQLREIIRRAANRRGLYGGATFKVEVMRPVRTSWPGRVSNVPSNITMTVIAALINANLAASRRPVTPPGFNAILSGRSCSLGRVLHVCAYCEGMIRAIDRAAHSAFELGENKGRKCQRDSLTFPLIVSTSLFVLQVEMSQSDVS